MFNKTLHCGASFELLSRIGSALKLWHACFFGYKIEAFPFQNNPNNLGPSKKMDLDFWDCFVRRKNTPHIPEA